MSKHGLHSGKAAMIGLLIMIGLALTVALVVAPVAFIIGLMIQPPSGHEITFTERCYFSLGIGAAGGLAVVILAVRDKLRDRQHERSRPGNDYMFKSLVSKFKQEFPQTAYELEEEDWKAVKIPAQDNNLGDMRISADWNDVILRIGDIFHVHFRADYHRLEPEEAEDEAISSALNFARDFFADQMVLRIKYRRGRPVSTSIFDPRRDACAGWIVSLSLNSVLGTLLFHKSQIKDFVWSGPYSPEK